MHRRRTISYRSWQIRVEKSGLTFHRLQSRVIYKAHHERSLSSREKRDAIQNDSSGFSDGGRLLSLAPRSIEIGLIEVCLPPVVRFHRKSRSDWWRLRRPVRCQPDMLNEYGSLVKDRREKSRNAMRACTRAITNGDQSPSNCARTMRVVPPESGRLRELLLPPTLSLDFCLPLSLTTTTVSRLPKPQKIQYSWLLHSPLSAPLAIPIRIEVLLFFDRLSTIPFCLYDLTTR